jgi:hypothetical protein
MPDTPIAAEPPIPRRGTMGHIVRIEPWGVVDLDTAKRRIFVRQDWEYEWLVAAGQESWSAEEQLAFHRAADRAVWAHWSNRAQIQVRNDGYDRRPQTDHFNWEIAGAALSLTFDIRMVRANGHWLVKAQKNDPGETPKPRAKVDTIKNVILLYATDLLVHRATRFDGDKWHEGFSVHAHEFGHTIGKVDEYEAGRPHYDDVGSIMNVGRQLRARHLSQICGTLRAMVPGCRFSAVVP